jgi:hypothetical protein
VNRKSFLFLSGLAGVAVIGGGYCLCLKSFNYKEVLAIPETLSGFCDSQLILAMGLEYLSSVPEENDSKIIIQALGVSLYSRSETLKYNLMEQIKQDFESQHTKVLGGWVVSLTEARQCALFALNHND